VSPRRYSIPDSSPFVAIVSFYSIHRFEIPGNKNKNYNEFLFSSNCMFETEVTRNSTSGWCFSRSTTNQVRGCENSVFSFQDFFPSYSRYSLDSVRQAKLGVS